MAHSIRFSNFEDFLLTQDEAQDLVDMFYRWEDARFFIHVDNKQLHYRGMHTRTPDGLHTIMLCKRNIVRDFRKGTTMGGNMKAPALRAAAGMVLVHELQHANQTKLHRAEEGFYRDHKYWNRACERDARQFVDEHMNEICAYFGVEAPARRKVSASIPGDEEAQAVIGLLSECSAVTMDDVRDELRASKILTPENVARVVQSLREQGIDISRS